MAEPKWKILVGDCRERLRDLPDNSVHMIWTSPPYFGLRDYGEDAQIGLEPTPEEFVEAIVSIMSEARRVLREDGTFWLNLGDSYAQKKGHGHWTSSEDKGDENAQKVTKRWANMGAEDIGLKPKDLIGIPWRVAFALQADGWYLRSDIIWAKGISGQSDFEDEVYDAMLRNGIDLDKASSVIQDLDLYTGNPMPESVRDRPSSAHEHIFLLSKTPRYFYDHIASRERLKHPEATGTFGQKHVHNVNSQYSHSGRDYIAPQGRNRRNVWCIPTKPFRGAHFATAPEALIEPCVKAGTSEGGCCPECGTPLERVVQKVSGGSIKNEGDGENLQGNRKGTNPVDYDRLKIKGAGGITPQKKVTLGWEPKCDCDSGKDSIPCTVLDPFAGAATTLLVAEKLGRHSIGIELNPEYAEIAENRLLEYHRKVTAPWEEGYVFEEEPEEPEELSFGALFEG